jgi:hypothetical protein
MAINYGNMRATFYRDFNDQTLNPTTGAIGGPITYSRNSTATYIGSDGYIKTATANTPRFTYEYDSNNNLVYRGLYIDNRSSTNMFTYSEDFSQNSWTKTNSSVASSSTLSPNGVDNGTKLTISASGGNISSSFSIMAKAAECSYLNISISDGTYSFNAYYDLATGATGNNTAGTTNQLTYVYKHIYRMGNGWYRCILCGYDNQSASTYTCTFTPSTTANAITGSSGDGILLFGANADYTANNSVGYHQCFTQYIKTTGSTTTCLADQFYVNSQGGASYSSFLSTFNENNFTVYCEFTVPYFFRSTISSNIISLYGSTRLGSNNYQSSMRVSNANISYLYRTPSGWDFGSFAIQESNNKMIITNKQSPTLISAMNGTLATSSASLVPAKFDSFYVNGICCVKKLIYIPSYPGSDAIKGLTTL